MDEASHNVTGVYPQAWHYSYQDWECQEGTIRRMMEWPNGRTKYPEVLWKWSYIKPILEEKGVHVDPDGYENCHIIIDGHDIAISPTEGYDVTVDGLSICWEK